MQLAALLLLQPGLASINAYGYGQDKPDCCDTMEHRGRGNKGTFGRRSSFILRAGKQCSTASSAQLYTIGAAARNGVFEGVLQILIRRFQAYVSLVCCFGVLVGSAPAQNAIQIEQPKGGLGWLTRPYQQPIIAPINLANTNRLESLVRAGNLYVSADDVVALALENNIDIEIQRYGPVLYRAVTKRAEGGGILRSVGVNVAPGPTSVSLTGVNLNASSGSTGAAGAGVSSSGIITQLGPAIPVLDPTFSAVANFSHSTTPFSNTILTGTTALINNTRSYQTQFAQTLKLGFNYQLTYASTHNNFNSNFYTINPYTQGYLDLQGTLPLLNGFGTAVNGRNILVAKNNEKVGDLQFKLTGDHDRFLGSEPVLGPGELLPGSACPTGRADHGPAAV